VNWGIPVKLVKRTSLNFGLRFGYSADKQFINSAENKIRDMQLRPELRFETSPNEKVNISLNIGTNYYHTRYSLQPDLNTNYFTHEIGTDFNWQLPKNFYFSTDLNYMINTRRADGYNASVPLWNASLSKLFLKYERGEFKLRVYDLLNQNVGITRTSNANYIEDSRVTILRRYFMLSVTYSLSKAGLKGGGAGNIRIIKR